MAWFYACQPADRSTMGTVRLKSDATTDSIEFVVKEMLVAISTNDIEKARYHVLEEGRVFRVRKDGMGFRSNSESLSRPPISPPVITNECGIR